MTERHARRFIFLIALILTGLASIPTMPSARTPAAPTVLIGATVIDGNGGPPIADAAIVIAGTRIEAVGPRSAVSIPPGANQVDARGRWILPGLIDTNVHLSLYER